MLRPDPIIDRTTCWARTASLLAVWISLALPAIARPAPSDGSEGGSPSGESTPGPTLADEAIGTLPTYESDDEDIQFSVQSNHAFDLLQQNLSLEVYAPEYHVEALFEQAAGFGFAVVGDGGVTPLGVPLARVRVFGSVRVNLNEALASLPDVALSLHFGSKYDAAMCTSAFGNDIPKLFSVLATGPDLGVDLSVPSVKAKFAADFFHLEAIEAGGHQGDLWMKVASGQVRIQLTSQ